MSKTFRLFAWSFCSLIAFSAHADDQKINPEFIWVPEASTTSSLEVQVGGGLLDEKGITGHHGSPIYSLVKANYSVSDMSSIFVDIPMAGTLSGGPDDFGIGNISVGGNHQFFVYGNTTLGGGVNFTFPTANSGSLIGEFTRNFYSFVNDQYAISPYLDIHTSNGKLAGALDVGINEQIFSPRQPGFDKAETTLFYDYGLDLAIDGPKEYWATIEFGGYSTLSYDNNNTVLFVAPGVRYQTDEMSIGLHLEAPLSSPSNDQIDFLVLTDVRFKF